MVYCVVHLIKECDESECLPLKTLITFLKLKPNARNIISWLSNYCIRVKFTPYISWDAEPCCCKLEAKGNWLRILRHERHIAEEERRDSQPLLPPHVKNVTASLPQPTTSLNVKYCTVLSANIGWGWSYNFYTQRLYLISAILMQINSWKPSLVSQTSSHSNVFTFTLPLSEGSGRSLAIFW
jgi:hypothetical protein